MVLSLVEGVGCHILAILENLLLGDFVVITMLVIIKLVQFYSAIVFGEV